MLSTAEWALLSPPAQSQGSPGHPGLHPWVQRSCPVWWQTFVCHKGLDFDKILPLDFHAPAPADLAKRISKVTAPVRRARHGALLEGAHRLWGTALRGESSVRTPRPWLGRAHLLPHWPALHDTPRYPGQGSRSQGLSVWPKPLAGSRDGSCLCRAWDSCTVILPT